MKQKVIGKTNTENTTVFAIPGMYGKANVIVTRTGYKALQSYRTIVCIISPKGKFYRTWDGYSNTTKKHVNAFCYMYGLHGFGKSDWCKLPVYKSAIDAFPCIYEQFSYNHPFWGYVQTDYLKKFKFLGKKV